jgi:hypothetical protein
MDVVNMYRCKLDGSLWSPPANPPADWPKGVAVWGLGDVPLHLKTQIHINAPVIQSTEKLQNITTGSVNFTINRVADSVTTAILVTK